MVSVTLTLTLKVSGGLNYFSLKCTSSCVDKDQIYKPNHTKLWRDSLKYGQKSLILCQFIYSVTLTLTLKFLFKAYCHDILTNAILHSILLKEEA